ncbi:hypothetical protein B0T10DRAFT_205115 [Thelonectria olida]|uniref:BAH domain-containing protein n=1 Tax=Thelonectria olida TaxID=1576542 RepID=A0A9P8VTL9_9HYPO|nr:hypothetical protein B0T10DRAFT_205115 [Thelonectria olida]
MAGAITGKWRVANGLIPSPSRGNSRQKKRKRSPTKTQKIKEQSIPFAFPGTPNLLASIDYYTVEPWEQWDEMTSYTSFIVKGERFERGDFIQVASEMALKRTRDEGASKFSTDTSDHSYIACILEIKAADEHHVFARVYWMYWPDELPEGTFEGETFIQGRQLYHGHNELIASNHMDIIDVLCVEGPARVKAWIDSQDDELDSEFYWRQMFDAHGPRLSSAESICRCKLPANPDHPIIGCSACEMWLHEVCLIWDALQCLHEQLQKHDGTIPGKWTQVNYNDRLLEGNALKSKGIDILATIVSRLLVQLSKPRLKDELGKVTQLELDPYRALPDSFEAELKMGEGPIALEIRNLGKDGSCFTFLAGVRCLGCGGPIN